MIDTLETQLVNKGNHTLYMNNYRNRDNRKHVDMQFGFIRIELTNPQDYIGLKDSP